MSRFQAPTCQAGAAAILAALILPMLAGRAYGADSAEPLIKAGHWKRARPLVQRSYKANPNDARANYQLSQIKAAFGDLEGALPLAEKAGALDPNNAEYHVQLGEVCGQTAEKASFFSKGKWAKRFKEEEEKAASLDLKNLNARFDLLEYDLQAPRLMGGGKDKAQGMAEEIAGIDPVSGDLARARVALDAKDRVRAGGYYARAAAQGSKNYDALITAAGFFLQPAGADPKAAAAPASTSPPADTGAAEKYAREAVALQPDRVEANSILARLYAVQSRWTDLDALLVESEKRIPDDLQPYYRAGLVLLDSGRELPRAENYFRKYLAQEPEPGGPTLAAAHWRIGLVLAKEGHTPEALAEVQTAVRLDPGFEPAQTDLKRLKAGL